MKSVLRSLIALVVFLQGCSEEPFISGTMSLESGWKPMVYLVQPQKLDDVAMGLVGKVIDSAKIDAKGNFYFTQHPDFESPMLLQVVVQPLGESYPNKLENENPKTDNYFPLVVQSGEKLKISTSIDHFQASFSVENPSSANAEMIQLRNLRLRAYEQYLVETDENEHNDEKLLEHEKALLSYQQTLMHFAENTEELLPALVALRWVSPENDYERVPEFLVEQCQKSTKAYPDHPWVHQLCQKADKGRLPILKGDLLPDMSLPMLEGGTILLSSVLKQKLILLDVWASWCAPCRVENRQVLLPLWNTYHDDGFEIIAYGLESSKVAWKNAVNRDGAFHWRHASHLMGDNNPLMDSLRIKTIPANFLLDHQGRVLAKNLHGKDLNDFVSEYMDSME